MARIFLGDGYQLYSVNLSFLLNPLPDDKILDWSKLKEFADDKLSVTTIKVLKVLVCHLSREPMKEISSLKKQTISNV